MKKKESPGYDFLIRNVDDIMIIILDVVSAVFAEAQKFRGGLGQKYWSSWGEYPLKMHWFWPICLPSMNNFSFPS